MGAEWKQTISGINEAARKFWDSERQQQSSDFRVLQRSGDPQQAEGSSSLKAPTDTLSSVSLDSALPVWQTSTRILLRAEAAQQPLHRACLLKEPEALMSG